MYVTVTWMDRLQETYRCKDRRTEDGLLWLYPEESGLVSEPEPIRCIPLANVRIWTVGR